MISSLRGNVAQIALDHAVIEVGGIGLSVLSTPGTLASLRLGSETHLATTLVVREDALTLFGFATAAERDLFLTLQSVTGVGPRLALAVIAVLSPDELAHAIESKDLAALTRVPGIGSKSAQRLILELSGKLAAPSGGAAPRGGSSGSDDIVAALTQLGWPQRDAADAVNAVNDSGSNKAEVLRAALKYLAAGRG